MNPQAFVHLEDGKLLPLKPDATTPGSTHQSMTVTIPQPRAAELCQALRTMSLPGDVRAACTMLGITDCSRQGHAT